MRRRTLTRKRVYRITEALGKPKLIGARCAVAQPLSEVSYPLSPEGQILGVTVWVLSGRFKESLIVLPPCKLTSVPLSEACRCDAYRFPHKRGVKKCQAV